MPGRLAVVAALLAAGLAPRPATAPADDEAQLLVRVLDPSGATIPGASVTVEATRDDVRDTVTDARGTATLSRLAPGRARVRAQIQGFEAREKTLDLGRGRNAVDIPLPLARLAEDVAVAPPAERSAGRGFGTVLTPAEIDALPDDPEEMEAALRQMAGPGAVLRMNGFSGGRLPPKSQIRQIRFQMNPYSAEHHEAGHVLIDVLTKPGLGAWRTGLRTSLRERGLNARPPLASEGVPDSYQRYGLTLEGPLLANRTSLALTLDGRLGDGARTMVGVGPQGAFSALAPTSSDKVDVTARLEHALSPTHTLRAEYQRLGHAQEGLAASGLDLEERAYGQRDTEHLLRLSDSGTLGKRIATETLLELRVAETVYAPRSTAPALQVLGAFSAGGAQVEGARRGTTLTLTQNFDWGVRNHAFRAGLKVQAERLRSDERRNAGGTFVFPSLEAYAAGRPSLFARRTGDPRVAFIHVLAGFYLQDEIKLGRDVTLSAGLRNELQTAAGGALQPAPRLGLAWALDSRTTLRVGGGMFNRWYESALHAETLRLDGERFAEYLVSDPPYPDAIGVGPAVPPSRLQRADALALGRGVRASVGLERTFGPARARIDYSHERWNRLPRSANLNAPSAAGVRPDPARGNVLEIQPAGRSRTHTLHLNAALMGPDRPFGFVFGYVHTHARSDGDGATSVPATADGLRGEWGPSPEDVPHRLFGLARARLPRGMAASLVARYESGAPYAVTTGIDENGDGMFDERPAGLARNAGRGDALFNLDARLSWSRGFGPSRTTGGPAARIVRLAPGEMPPDGARDDEDRRYQVSVYVQAFNATNHANLRRYGGILASPFFGRALEADPGRRVELGATFSF